MTDRITIIKEKYTPETKDLLLKHFLNSSEVGPYTFNAPQLAENFGLPLDIFDAMLKNFAHDGLIKYQGLSSSGGRATSITIYFAALEFFNKGAYTTQDQILNQQLLILQNQIKELQPTIPIDKYNNILSIIDNTISIASAFLKA